MVTPLRVVFFGTPAFAVPTLRALLDSPHVVTGVVTQPDRPRGRGQKVSDAPVKKLAVERGLEVLQPEALRLPELGERIRSWNADLGVVAAYGRLIPDELLTVPRLGMINVHASLLPRYRGAAPVHRAIIAGETTTGVTIMRVVRQLDAGPMLATATRAIGPDDTADIVERDLAELGANLLRTVVDAMGAGPVIETPQDDRLATYAARLTKTEGVVDWTQPARAIHDRVRGLHPWPHAYTYLDGERLILLSTEVDPAPASEPAGTIVHVASDGVHVAAGDGTRIVLREVQVAGRRPMGAREFLTGHTIRVGTQLSQS